MTTDSGWGGGGGGVLASKTTRNTANLCGSAEFPSGIRLRSIYKKKKDLFYKTQQPALQMAEL